MPRLSTIVWWAFLIFVAWFIVTSPHAAAQAVHGIGHLFTQAAHGVSAFITNLSS